MSPARQRTSPPEVPGLEGRLVVAAFDFDGTLTRGGSVWRFLAAVCHPGRVVMAAVAILPRLLAGAVLGGAHADAAKEALFARTLAGLPADDVARRAASFGLAHYRRHARPEVRRRLEWHLARGHRVVIVSASPELYLEPVGRELQVHGVIGTKLEVGPDGRLTGRYDGVNCRGPEKIGRLRRWVESTAGAGRPTAPHGDDEPPAAIVWAYGNSAGDRQLLAGADVGIDVGRLGRLGRLRSFPRLRDVPLPEG